MLNIKDNPLFIYQDFKSLFLARVISAIGDKFFTLSLVWWVITTKGEFALSLIMTATFLPAVIFSPIAGTFVDRYSKKYIMIIADIFRALILFLVFVFFKFNVLSFSYLLIFIFMIYSFAPFFETATASSLILVTSKQHLSQATAMDSSSISISNVIGAAFGSIFIALVGFDGSIFLNIITYLLSFLFVLRIKAPLRVIQQNHFLNSFWNDMIDGLKYIKNNLPTILNLLIYFAFLNFFVSPILIIIPIIVKSILNEDVKWLAIIEVFFAVGSLTGPFIMSFKKSIYKNLLILFLTVFSFSISIGLSALSQNKFVTSLLLFICGFSISVGNVSILSYFQHKIEDEYRGRFFSIVNLIVYAIMPVSFIVNGFLFEKFKASTVIILNSFCSFIIATFGILYFIYWRRYEDN